MQPLSPSLNAAVMTMARKVWPFGYDVTDEDPHYPDNPEAFYAEITQTKRIQVWSGASDQTIFGEREINWDFRAWHDWTHYVLHAGFSPAGERAVCQRQQEDLRRVFGSGPELDRWCRILEAEVVGQLEFFMARGFFPENQRAFTLDYLNR